MKSQYFYIFMYISWFFLHFWWCFFVESLANRAAMPELFNWSINKKTPYFNRTTACPLWPEYRHWGIGIPGNTFGYTIQAWTISHLPGARLPRWLQVSIEFPTDVSVFNATEKIVFIFTIYDYIFRLRQIRCDIWRNLSHWLRSLFI